METLFTTCDENDYNVPFTAEESLNKFVKNLKEAVLTRIQVELHRIIKHNPSVEPKALKEYYELIFRILGRSINGKEIKKLLMPYSVNMLSHGHSTFSNDAINQLFEHQNQNANTRLIIGYLGSIKNLTQLLDYSNLFDFDHLLKDRGT
ncbi:unnamed protein product [Rotaria sordida]|uniref:Uncharacterized protein n=1 Tax=Rotaria sordida TaxID=392033 RepID=A0A820C2I8_9BILA|nr:unnamed protein product [Rotaria sordida]